MIVFPNTVLLFYTFFSWTHGIIPRHSQNSENKPDFNSPPFLHPFNLSGQSQMGWQWWQLLQKGGLKNRLHKTNIILQSLRPKKIMVSTSILTAVQKILLWMTLLWSYPFKQNWGFRVEKYFIYIPHFGRLTCSGHLCSLSLISGAPDVHRKCTVHLGTRTKL